MEVSIMPSTTQVLMRGIYIALLGIGVYVSVLGIKALRAYVKKNS